MLGSPGIQLAREPRRPRDALIVATSNYQDQRLGQLRTPARDARALVDVLENPEIGGFTVVPPLIDADGREIQRAILRFLSNRSSGDLVLVYLSCHGLLDRRNRLFFAASDTMKDEVSVTGVPATWLKEQLEECQARQRVLILDCCFSGAFAHGAKGDADLDLEARLSGRGQVILTASRAAEYSFEGDALPGAAVSGSVFTDGLVEGLRTGEADVNGDGYVYDHEAFDYAARYVQSHGAGQHPQRSLTDGEGTIVLARSPRGVWVSDSAALTSDGESELVRQLRAKLVERTREVEQLRGQAQGDSVASARSRAEVGEAEQRFHEAAAAYEEAAASVAALAISVESVPSLKDFMHLDGHAGKVYRVAFSPVGGMLASAGRDGTTRLWHTATEAAAEVMRSGGGEVRAVAFSPDGRQLAYGGDGRTVKLLDIETREQLHSLRQDGVVCGAEFSPGGTYLATCGTDGGLRLWRRAEQEWRSWLPDDRIRGRVRGIAFSPRLSPHRTQLLASCGAPASTVRVWEEEFGWQPRVLRGHRAWVWNVTFSPDGGTLASCGEDGTVQLWDTATWKRSCVLDVRGKGRRARGAYVYSVAFSPNGQLLVSCHSDGIVRLWDAVTQEHLGDLHGHRGIVCDAKFSPDGSQLASAGEDGIIRLWR